jgi:hypothetical protein
MRKTLILMLSALTVLAVSVGYGQISSDEFDFEVGPGTQSKLAQAGFKFLSIPVGARQTALGASAMALSNDANAMFWNPAGMSQVANRDISINYNKWIAEIAQQSAAFAINLGIWGVFGVSAIMMDYGDFYGTRRADNDAGYVDTETFSPSAFAFGLAYARQVTDKFSFGAHLKYAKQDLGTSWYVGPDAALADAESRDNSMGLFAADFGTQFLTGFKDLKIGMSITNFSQEKKYEEEAFPLPLQLAFGASMNLFSLFSEGGPHKLNLAVDASHPRDFQERLNWGLEYWFMDTLAIRGGYKMRYDEEDVTFGAGVKQDLGPLAGKIDYSFNNFGRFDPVHRITVGAAF